MGVCFNIFTRSRVYMYVRMKKGFEIVKEYALGTPFYDEIVFKLWGFFLNLYYIHEYECYEF